MNPARMTTAHNFTCNLRDSCSKPGCIFRSHVFPYNFFQWPGFPSQLIWGTHKLEISPPQKRGETAFHRALFLRWYGERTFKPHMNEIPYLLFLSFFHVILFYHGFLHLVKLGNISLDIVIKMKKWLDDTCYLRRIHIPGDVHIAPFLSHQNLQMHKNDSQFHLLPT